jgi:hypothetical protein
LIQPTLSGPINPPRLPTKLMAAIAAAAAGSAGDVGIRQDNLAAKGDFSD